MSTTSWRHQMKALKILSIAVIVSVATGCSSPHIRPAMSVINYYPDLPEAVKQIPSAYRLSEQAKRLFDRI